MKDIPQPFTLRRAGPADMKGILELINLVQPHLPWTEEHFLWQFRNGYRQAHLYLVLDGARIVSLYAAVPQRFLVAGRECEARHVQDVMTHPDYRGKGFLHALAVRCREEIVRDGAIGYTFPNEGSEKSFRRSGWRELCRVPLRLGATSPAQAGDDPFTPVPCFDERADLIFRSAPKTIGLLRDAAYLNWRWGRPDTVYHRWLIGENDGLVVAKLYPQDAPQRVHLADLVLRAGAEHRLEPVLEFVSGFGSRHGATTLTAFLPDGHPYAPLFERRGLFLAPPERWVFYLPQPGTEGLLAHPGNWTILHGDHDLV